MRLLYATFAIFLGITSTLGGVCVGVLENGGWRSFALFFVAGVAIRSAVGQIIAAAREA